MKRPAAQDTGTGSVRIIAGKWRGRRLPVPDVAGLRPSGDRSRETLFSWLQPHLPGACCVDLFAGTGVLGIEAVSRGAAAAVLVEQSRPAVAALRRSVEALQAHEITVVQADALAWMSRAEVPMADVVFVDPPFGLGLGQDVLDRLGSGSLLSPGGLVYLETGRTAPPVRLAPGWQLLRDKTVGEVRMQLLQRGPVVA